MKKIVSFLTLSAAAVMLYAGPAHALSVYSDITAWSNAALALGITPQNFSQTTFTDYPLIHSGTLTPSAGTVNATVLSTQQNMNYGITLPADNQNPTRWYDQIDPANPTTTTFTFPQTMVAVAGTFNLSVDGFGQGLLLTIINTGNSTSYTDARFQLTNDGFWGVVLDQSELQFGPFDQLQITGLGANNAVETFTITDLTYATGVASVPEPSTFLLIGAGFAGLMVWRRRR